MFKAALEIIFIVSMVLKNILREPNVKAEWALYELGVLRGYTLMSVIIGLIIMPLAAMAWAGGLNDREKAIKAGYIFHFAKFIDWPSSSNADSGKFTFCVAEDQDFAHIFRNSVKGKTIRNRSIDVIDISVSGADVDCQVVYIPQSDPVKVGRILSAYSRKSILSVGDASDFVVLGGIIGFFVDSGRLRFEIGLSNAGNTGLKISSELLGLARVHP